MNLPDVMRRLQWCISGGFEWEPLFDTIDEIMTDYVLHYAPFVDYLSLYIRDKINSLGFEMHLKMDGHTTMIWIYIPYLICYMIEAIFVRQDVMPSVVSATQHWNLRYNYNTNSMVMFAIKLVNQNYRLKSGYIVYVFTLKA